MQLFENSRNLLPLALIQLIRRPGLHCPLFAISGLDVALESAWSTQSFKTVYSIEGANVRAVSFFHLLPN